MEPNQIKTLTLPTSHPQLAEIQAAADAIMGIYIKTGRVRVSVGKYAIEFRWQGGNEWAFDDITTSLLAVMKVL